MTHYKVSGFDDNQIVWHPIHSRDDESECTVISIQLIRLIDFYEYVEPKVKCIIKKKLCFDFKLLPLWFFSVIIIKLI